MTTDRGRHVKINIENRLWAVSAGRCEFRGCNRYLGEHLITKTEGNYGEKAHIEAVSENGPRYRELMPDEELNSADNLMLACAGCHKHIDENVDMYPVDILKKMKREHEERILKVTEIDDTQKTLMVSYFADIKDFQPQFEDKLFCKALVKSGKVPVNRYAENLGTENMPFRDGTQQFYEIEKAVLQGAKERILKSSMNKEEGLAVFALAPMPLLIKLGELISDISNTSVYQCHREGEKWAWKDTNETVEYIVEEPKEKGSKVVALNISLSAEIVQERIIRAAGEIPTYKITISEPNRTFVTNEEIMNEFVKAYRRCMEKLRNDNPELEMVKVFPAMPNSLAIRMGMDYMPKVDPVMEIYDELGNGFVKALEVGGENAR